MTIEVEIREIKELLGELNRKLDAMVQDKETLAMMVMSQQALKEFFLDEPDLYSAKDIKVAYR